MTQFLTETRERFLALGIDPQIVTGAELTTYLRAEREKWGKLIRAMGIKAE